MDNKLLERLRKITAEEREILSGKQIQKKIYSNDVSDEFIIDANRLLKKGSLIEIRPHTRFIDFPKHKHNYVEMVYMCSGSSTHIINGKDKVTLVENDLLILNQHAIQEIQACEDDDVAVNFIILPQFFEKSITMLEKENVLRDFLISTLSSNNSESSYLHFSTKDLLPVKNLLENMIWSLYQSTSTANTINQTTMGLLFMNLSQFVDKIDVKTSNSFEQNMIFSILKYIETNYKNGTLSEISEQLNEPTYFVSRLLKKHTGKNFKELLQERKLQQASYWLKESTMTIDDIIEAVGYKNSSFFYNNFKEKYGCSPKSYRNLSIER